MRVRVHVCKGVTPPGKFKDENAKTGRFITELIVVACGNGVICDIMCV